MTNTVLSLRWIHCAGYEIRLPNDKRIVIDPFVTTNAFEDFTWEDFEGADYIILSHTHGDHVSDVGNLVKKFNSQLFVGQMSCNSLVEYFDLNYSNVWPVLPGECYHTDDMTLHVYRGKHTLQYRDDYKPSQAYRIPAIGGPEGSFRDGNHFGGMEMLNYGITTREGLRILVSGGVASYQDIYRVADEFRPNIVIRQAGATMPPEEYAALVAPYQAQYAFPHHHEKIPVRQGIEMEEYCRKANAELERLGSCTRVIYPEKFRWVDIVMSAELRK